MIYAALCIKTTSVTVLCSFQVAAKCWLKLAIFANSRAFGWCPRRGISGEIRAAKSDLVASLQRYLLLMVSAISIQYACARIIGPRGRAQMRAFPTHVARGCVSVCWYTRLVQKRLNRSRCCLGADACACKEPCNTCGPGPHWEGAFLKVNMCRSIVKYSDYAAVMRPFVKLLRPLAVIITNWLIVVLAWKSQREWSSVSCPGG